MKWLNEYNPQPDIDPPIWEFSEHFKKCKNEWVRHLCTFATKHSGFIIHAEEIRINGYPYIKIWAKNIRGNKVVAKCAYRYIEDVEDHLTEFVKYLI